MNFRDPSGLVFTPLVPLPQAWTVTVNAPPPDPIPTDVSGAAGSEGMMIVLGSETGDGAGGGGPQHEQDPFDACKGVRVSDLDYNREKKYRRGGTTSAQTHIMDRHINPASGASQYITDPPSGRDDVFNLVKNFFNALTFVSSDARAVVKNNKGEVTALVKKIPLNDPHGVYPSKVGAWVGTDAMMGGAYTRDNTLFLDPDCKGVQTSHPGFPSLPGLGDNPDNP